MKSPSLSPPAPVNRREGIYYILTDGRGIGPEGMEGAIGAARRRHMQGMLIRPHTRNGNAFTAPEVLGLLKCTYDTNILGQILARPYPCINLSNSHGRLPGMGNLLSDDPAVGRMAARHLLERGHRSFLAVSYAGRPSHEQRAEGFAEEVRAAGYPVRSFSHTFAGDKEQHKTYMAYISGMREIIAATLETVPLGAGIFATNDELALLIQQVMQRFYPEHLETSGLIGVDNVAPRFGYFGVLPELSSIRPAFRNMGADAMDWLIDHPGPAGREVVETLYRLYPPAGVAARASTAAGACADPVTARMIRWIWERMREGLPVSVAELVREHHMGRKTIERRFSAHADCTPGELIQKLRLDLAREMLRSSDRSIAEISQRCGFSKQDVLSRALRAAEGCTPREYRRRVTSGE